MCDDLNPNQPQLVEDKVSLVTQSIKPTIKADFIGNILQAYHAQGFDSDALLTSIGMKPWLKMGSARISVLQFFELTHALQKALDDEMLGYMEKPVPIGSLEMLCRTMVKLPTLGDAITCYSEFLSLFNAGMPVYLQEKANGKHQLKLCLQSELQQQSPYYMQRMLLTAYKSLCWLSNSRIALDRVGFTVPIERDANELAFVFDCENITESQHCQLDFADEIFQLPVLRNTKEIDEFSANFGLYTLLWPTAGSIEARIRDIIGPNISNGFPSFQEVAAKLAVSPQTLSRRLQESRTSYQTIKDDVRRDAAIALLLHSHLSIKEVAFEIGFKESSSFSKAFKQWVGVAPSEYRL